VARDLSIRVAIGNSMGRHSTVWSVFSSNNEVYATHRTMGGVEKLSFHSSRICRRAFTGTHQLPPSMTDRVIQGWTRAETVPAGKGQGVAVLTVIFPESHLSPDISSTTKQAAWLPSPMPGEARFLQAFFTRESEQYIRSLLAAAGHSFVAYHSLPNGEAVAIRSWANEFEQPDLIMEASHNATRDLVLPSRFEVGVRREVSLTLYFQPEEMRCIELTGYWVHAGEAHLRFPAADTFSRSEVIERRTT
jgi:hypothetical protein